MQPRVESKFLVWKGLLDWVQIYYVHIIWEWQSIASKIFSELEREGKYFMVRNEYIYIKDQRYTYYGFLLKQFKK